MLLCFYAKGAPASPFARFRFAFTRGGEGHPPGSRTVIFAAGAREALRQLTLIFKGGDLEAAVRSCEFAALPLAVGANYTQFPRGLIFPAAVAKCIRSFQRCSGRSNLVAHLKLGMSSHLGVLATRSLLCAPSNKAHFLSAARLSVVSDAPPERRLPRAL